MATEALEACPGNVLGVGGWFVESYEETVIMCPQLVPCQTLAPEQLGQINQKKSIHTSSSPDLGAVLFGILVVLGCIASTKLGGVPEGPRSRSASSAVREAALEPASCKELGDSSLFPTRHFLW